MRRLENTDVKARINVAFTNQNIEYVRLIAGFKGVSITAYINELLERDRERESETVAALENLKRKAAGEQSVISQE